MSRTVAHVQVEGKDLALSNLGKVLYPDVGFTKGQAIDYYVRVSSVLLPHLSRRPLTLKRYPDGVQSGHFYEKRCPPYHPDWVDIADVPSDRRGTIRYCTVENLAALVWVANLASLELHTLLSTAEHPDRPTMMVFDLDPGEGATVLDSCRVAKRLRKLLERLGLNSLAKTSGGRGLHLYVPLNTAVTHDQTKQLSHELADHLARDRPEEITANMRKALRAGKVFIDWSQNDQNKTTVCVYSLRARDRPTVSTPITWAEIDAALRKGDTDTLRFEADDVLRRVEQRGDLFEQMLTLRQKLP